MINCKESDGGREDGEGVPQWWGCDGATQRGRDNEGKNLSKKKWISTSKLLGFQPFFSQPVFFIKQ